MLLLLHRKEGTGALSPDAGLVCVLCVPHVPPTTGKEEYSFASFGNLFAQQRARSRSGQWQCIIGGLPGVCAGASTVLPIPISGALLYRSSRQTASTPS